MSEIYWITRLDALNAFFTAIAGVFTVVLLVLFIFLIISIYEYIYNGHQSKEYKGYIYLFEKLLFRAGIVTVIAYIGFIFTPTTKQAFVIYQTDETIKCVKSNDDTKENSINKKDSIIWIKTICPKCYYQFEFYKMKSKLYDN